MCGRLSNKLKMHSTRCRATLYAQMVQVLGISQNVSSLLPSFDIVRVRVSVNNAVRGCVEREVTYILCVPIYARVCAHVRVKIFI